MDRDRIAMRVSAIVLTFNSERVIADTLNALRLVSDDIHIVNSFSTDQTVEIAKAAGAEIHTRAFKNYADQRNWAIDSLPTKSEWQLHLDADEILSMELIEEIKRELIHTNSYDGFFIPRKIRFLGRDLNYGGYFPIYHMRLFRAGHARVEDRLYDQHFVLMGRGKKLRNLFIDNHQMSLSEWTLRHNRWSDLEVAELSSEHAKRFSVRARATGNVLERKRARKSAYLRLPILLRPFLLFIYRYVVRLGFLDGQPGLIYCVLQAFWFRFLIDAKLQETKIISEPSKKMDIASVPNPRDINSCNNLSE